MQNKRRILSSLIVFLLIPVTIFCGEFLGDRKYNFISFIIIIYIMILFFMAFENKRPRVREVVLIAVLSAIAVSGRVAFYMIPEFKAVVAIIIISGVCLGAETGFLVGAVSAFVSNFFFGQGPWTPWQMFSLGLIGFLSGAIKIKKTKLSLCLFSGFLTFFVYGGIMNFGSLIIFNSKFTLNQLIATYISGFWFDIIHTIATIIFMYFISIPMIEKIDRIKTKYGIIS